MIKKGASLYYASDKNIFDAINQSKVNNDTLQTMFLRRNIICSKSTEREDLAEFFSRLTHDYLDHKDLSNRLGVVTRREKTTCIDVSSSKINSTAIQKTLDSIKRSLADSGDIARIVTDGNTKTLWIDYTLIDYRKTEFSQLQKRKGYITITKVDGYYAIRSTKSEYIDNVRDEFINALGDEIKEKLEKKEISLFNHPETHKRNKFIYDLISGFDGYLRKDVTDVYVYKPQPSAGSGTSEEHHVERVLLKGYGVTQSDILRNLTSSAQDYYMVKVGWVVRGDSGAGATYEIEASFSNPNECTGFTYILRSVTDVLEDSTLSKNKRSPNKTEIDNISLLIENKARELMEIINKP